MILPSLIPLDKKRKITKVSAKYYYYNKNVNAIIEFLDAYEVKKRIMKCV